MGERKKKREERSFVLWKKIENHKYNIYRYFF